jgi:hypothetical protein
MIRRARLSGARPHPLKTIPKGNKNPPAVIPAGPFRRAAQTGRIVPSCRYRACHDNASSSRCGVCLPELVAVARSR